MDSNDLFEKAQFSASLHKDFKGFPISFIALNWRDNWEMVFDFLYSSWV